MSALILRLVTTFIFLLTICVLFVEIFWSLVWDEARSRTQQLRLRIENGNGNRNRLKQHNLKHFNVSNAFPGFRETQTGTREIWRRNSKQHELKHLNASDRLSGFNNTRTGTREIWRRRKTEKMAFMFLMLDCSFEIILANAFRLHSCLDRTKSVHDVTSQRRCFSNRSSGLRRREWYVTSVIASSLLG